MSGLTLQLRPKLGLRRTPVYAGALLLLLLLGGCGAGGQAEDVYVTPPAESEAAVQLPAEQAGADTGGGLPDTDLSAEGSKPSADAEVSADVPVSGQAQQSADMPEQPSEPDDPDAQAARPVEETAAESAAAYWRIDGGDANIRTAPDYGSKSILIGREGRDLEYLHRKMFDPRDSRIWYNVQTNNGDIGWISRAVVIQSDGRYFAEGPEAPEDFSGDSSTTAAADSGSGSAVRYYAIREANIRQSPSINAATVGQTAGGSALDSLNDQWYDPSDGRTWYYVRTPSGLDGWISSKMVSGYAPSADPADAEDAAQVEAGGVYYENCDAAEAAGAAPVYAGEAGYAGHLDRDSDGIGCEISDWDGYDGGSSDYADVPVSSAGSVVYFRNCSVARAAGAAPVYAGDPGYSRKLDRDGDGVGCE